jgi:hypothetical protein
MFGSGYAGLGSGPVRESVELIPGQYIKPMRSKAFILKTN